MLWQEGSGREAGVAVAVVVTVVCLFHLTGGLRGRPGPPLRRIGAPHTGPVSPPETARHILLYKQPLFLLPLLIFLFGSHPSALVPSQLVNTPGK